MHAATQKIEHSIEELQVAQQPAQTNLTTQINPMHGEETQKRDRNTEELVDQSKTKIDKRSCAGSCSAQMFQAFCGRARFLERGFVVNAGFSKHAVVHFVSQFRTDTVRKLAQYGFLGIFCAQPVAVWSIAKCVRQIVADESVVLTLCAMYIVLVNIFMVAFFKALGSLRNQDANQDAMAAQFFSALLLMENAHNSGKKANKSIDSGT